MNPKTNGKIHRNQSRCKNERKVTTSIQRERNREVKERNYHHHQLNHHHSTTSGNKTWWR